MERYCKINFILLFRLKSPREFSSYVITTTNFAVIREMTLERAVRVSH